MTPTADPDRIPSTTAQPAVEGQATAAQAEVAQAEIEARLLAFIAEAFYLDESESLASDSSLIDSGIVDSTGILELVMFLEEAFGVEVQDDDIRPENLDTVRAAAIFVLKKRAEAG